MDYHNFAASKFGDQNQARANLIKIKRDHAQEWMRSVSPGTGTKGTNSTMAIWGEVADHLISCLTQAQEISPTELSAIDNEIEHLTDRLQTEEDTDFEPIGQQCQEIMEVARPILQGAPHTGECLQHLVEACHKRKIEITEEPRTNEEQHSPKVQHTIKKTVKFPSLKEIEKKASSFLELLNSLFIPADDEDAFKEIISDFDVHISALKKYPEASQLLLEKLLRVKNDYLNEFVSAQLAKLEKLPKMIFENKEGQKFKKTKERTARKTGAKLSLPDKDEIFTKEHRSVKVQTLGDLAILATHLKALNVPYLPDEENESTAGENFQKRINNLEYKIRELLFHAHEGKRADARMRERVGKNLIPVTPQMISKVILDLRQVAEEMHDQGEITLDKLNAIRAELEKFNLVTTPIQTQQDKKNNRNNKVGD